MAQRFIPLKTGTIQVSVSTVHTLYDLINTAISGVFDYSKTPMVDYVRFSPEGTVRYTMDGSDPTASTGLIAVANGDYELIGVDIKTVKFTSSSGTIVVNIQVGACVNM